MGKRNTPFKSAAYTGKKKKSVVKTLKQIIQAENYDLCSLDLPTYQSIEVGPSVIPSKKYCDLSGHSAKYQDFKTGLRYCLAHEYLAIRKMTQEQVDFMLSLRKAAIAIR